MTDIDKAKRARLLFLITGAVSAFVGVAALAAHLLLSDRFITAKNYTPLIIILAVCAAGLYSAVFLLFSAYDRAVAVRLIAVAYEVGPDNVTEIAARMGWKESATEKFIKKCHKWGYLIADRSEQ
ncbi:MAG: hypothetical protein IJ515_06195 [Clostridia bacterium]|nr:hypothetical protein [Clostridia bacterium]